MTIVTDILKQMSAVSQPQRKFLAVLFATILALRGRVTGRNLSRYCQYSERTMARQFRAAFDWPDFHQRVMTLALDPRSELVSAQDASFIPKSGKHTFGLGHFFNGCASRAERGLEISTMAVVDVTRRCAFTLVVAQTPPGKEKAPRQSAKDETRIDFYKQQLHDHRHRLPPTVTYHCVDGYFAKKAWKYDPDTHRKHVEEKRIWWGKDGTNIVPALKLFLSEVRNGMTPHNWWSHEEVGHTDESKKEINIIFGNDNAFDTPKPERLIQRILQISTNENDLVLDSFLGSGTTAAVAHKMGRCYIGIEMGDHAVTHCAPRLKKVIEGEQGGISEAVNWKGGGGFRFYKLGAPVFDSEGRINPQIRFVHLAAHVWFVETLTALHKKSRSPFLGAHNGTAYYLLYNGILGDKRPDGGNVLTSRILAELPAHAGPKVIYGEACRLGPVRLKALSIVFKQTPYDVKAR